MPRPSKLDGVVGHVALRTGQVRLEEAVPRVARSARDACNGEGAGAHRKSTVDLGFALMSLPALGARKECITEIAAQLSLLEGGQASRTPGGLRSHCSDDATPSLAQKVRVNPSKLSFV